MTTICILPDWLEIAITTMESRYIGYVFLKNKEELAIYLNFVKEKCVTFLSLVVFSSLTSFLKLNLLEKGI